MTIQRWPALAGLGVLVLAAAGCGETRPKVYPAEGKVVFADGKPVTEGSVEFELDSTEHKVGKNPRSAIGPDGHFKLTTFDEGDGAAAGEHRVVVLPPLREPTTGTKKP